MKEDISKIYMNVLSPRKNRGFLISKELQSSSFDGKHYNLKRCLA